MITKTKLFVVLLILKSISLETSNERIENNGTDVKPDYMGEKFPVKYLEVDNEIPTSKDFDYYLMSLKSVVDYSAQNPNDTEINKSLGFYFMKVILKRTLRDSSEKLSRVQLALIRNIIGKSEDVLSHHVYMNRQLKWEDQKDNLIPLFTEEAEQIYSMGKFNRNRFKFWIISKGNLNKYIEDMDEATLAKMKYAELILRSTHSYFIRIDDSDECLSRVARNPIPVDIPRLRPCRPDPFCKKCIHSSPSIAYGLSHRMLNLMMYRHSRRCYWVTEKDDAYHLDILCAFMYREAVYLARRGYFARDLFLEHVALCAMLGYEEFHRRNWFHKAASWINERGCITEDLNHIINNTQLALDDENDEEKRKELRDERNELLKTSCHGHPMALLKMVLAHGIRHAANYMNLSQ